METITSGCGRGKKCNIGWYQLPYHGLDYKEHLEKRRSDYEADRRADEQVTHGIKKTKAALFAFSSGSKQLNF